VTTRGSTTLTSAADALFAEEVRRTRELLRITWVIAVGVLGSLWILPGDRDLGLALAGAIVAGLVGSIAMFRLLRDPKRYDPLRLDALAVVAIVCGQLGILYVGVFSAAPLMVALGLYFFCRTESTASAIAIYVIAAGAHAVEAALVIGGVIADPGFYPIRSTASLPSQIAGQLLLQVGYGLCFWLARITRRSSLRAIEQLQHATRIAAQRDVQLAELRRDLDRALEIGGAGPFTGHTFGAWQLGKLLGRGAMGEVYEATHATSGADAAVKVLRRDVLAQPHNVERFFREVRVASAIDAPHSCRVIEASTHGDPLPFLALERLHGKTLAELLRDRGNFTGPDLLALVDHTASVLELARVAGVVHRDIKPQNLFRTEDGTWKLLDFGVAVLADSTGTLTRGRAVGTPAYMSPEQARGDAVDHRTDVYALGAILYRCIAGRAPFGARDTPSLLYAVVHAMPVRPSTLAPVAAAVDAVLMIALAKARDQRFASAAELRDAMRAALAGTLPAEMARRAVLLDRLHPWQ
jgi:tRNA A-37 threonylcarbamoyl transferase component Bud32